MWEWPSMWTVQCTQVLVGKNGCFALQIYVQIYCVFAYMQISVCTANVQWHREKGEMCVVCERAPGMARGNGHTHVQAQPGRPLHVCEQATARGSRHRNAKMPQEHAQANVNTHGTRVCKRTCKSAQASTPKVHPCCTPGCAGPALLGS